MSDITENIEEKRKEGSPLSGSVAKSEKGTIKDITLQAERIRETLDDIREMERGEEGEELPSNNKGKHEEISSIPKAEVVDFGGRQKKLKEGYLKNWTPEAIKKEPILFIEDILEDIWAQKKTDREAVIPKDVLGVVLQLLEDELDFSIESDGKVFELAKRAFDSSDTSLIVQELYNIKDFFKVNAVVKNYLNEEKEDEERNEEKQLGIEISEIEKPVQKTGTENKGQIGNIFQREHTIEELVKKKENPANSEESAISFSQGALSREVIQNKNTIRIEGEKGIEKEGKEKRYIEIVKELVRMKLKMEEIRREMIKKEGIMSRLRIDNGKGTMLDSEYENIEKEYEELMKTLLIEGVDKGEIEEKVSSMCSELERRNAKFVCEKAGEYIQHLKKIVEYQVELLPEGKRKLYEKIVAFIENEEVKIMIGAMILGIPIEVPETGKTKWLTERDKTLLVELGISLKNTGGECLKMAYKKILEIRGTICEKKEEGIKDGDRIKLSGPVLQRAQAVGFFNNYNVEPKNNFLETKKQILES